MNSDLVTTMWAVWFVGMLCVVATYIFADLIGNELDDYADTRERVLNKIETLDADRRQVIAAKLEMIRDEDDQAWLALEKQIDQYITE